MYIVNLLLIAYVYLVYLNKFTIASPYLAIGLCYYVFIYLPGYYLAKYFYQNSKIDKFEIIPVALCCGYVFFMPLDLFAYAFKISLDKFLIYYIVLLLAWLTYNNFSLNKTSAFKFEKIKTAPWIIAGFSGMLLISFFMADHFGGFISGNFLSHVGSIRKLLDFNIIRVENAYSQDFKYPQNFFSSYYLFLALVSKLTKLDPVYIWIYLPQFILPVGLIANFYLAKRVLGRAKLALYYLFVYFVYYIVYNVNPVADGYGWNQSELSACNNYISLGVYLPVIVGIVIDYAKNNSENINEKLVYLLPLLFLADGLIHAYVQLKTYYFIYSLAFMCFLIRPPFLDYKKIIKAVLISSVGLAMVFYVYLQVNDKTLNPAYLNLGGTGGCLPMKYFGKWLLTDPYYTLLRDPLVPVGAAIFIFTIPFIRASLPSFYIFSIFFTVFFVLFNPVILYIGGRFHPAYERITRLYTLVPFCFALTFPLTNLSGIIKDEKYVKLFKIIKFILIGASLCSIVLLLAQSPERLKKLVFTKEYSLDALAKNDGLYKLVRAKIPQGSVVMMDLSLTTWWTTYFSHYIIAHAFDMHVPPNFDQTQRKKDVQYFYKNRINEKSLQILKEYRADYVIFNSKDVPVEKDEYKSYFEPVYTSNNFSIYKVVKEQ